MIGRPYKIGAAVLLAAVLITGGYFKGKADGRANMLRDTVAAYQKRNAIDGKVRDMDAVAVCVELGGLPDECQQLRWLGSAAEGE